MSLSRSPLHCHQHSRSSAGRSRSKRDTLSRGPWRRGGGWGQLGGLGLAEAEPGPAGGAGVPATATPQVPARSGGRCRTMAGSGAPRFVRRAAQTAASSSRHGDGSRRLRAPHGLQARPRDALPGLSALLGEGLRLGQGWPGKGCGQLGGVGAGLRGAMGHAVAQPPALAAHRVDRRPGVLRGIPLPRRGGARRWKGLYHPGLLCLAWPQDTLWVSGPALDYPSPFHPPPRPCHTPPTPAWGPSPCLRGKSHFMVPRLHGRSPSPLCICKVLACLLPLNLQCDQAIVSGGLPLLWVEDWELWSLDPAVPQQKGGQ